MITVPFNFNDPLHAAISAINATHGRGDVVKIDSTHYHVKLQYGTAKFRYHVSDGTVHARGTSKKFFTGTKDGRFTITKEHTGAPQVQYVVRFCDDWLDLHFDTALEALEAREKAIAEHNAKL